MPSEIERFGARLTNSRRSFLRSIALAGAFYHVRGAFAEQLVLTPAQTEGPYYPDKLPLDLDNDLIYISDAITPAVGEITWLSGRVLDQNGNPVRGALVEIWQADDRGAYIHSASPITNRDRFFQGIGRFVTGSNGEYLFRTVKPGIYPGRTRHIHCKVHYPGGQTLTTQIYVQGEPLNNNDSVLNGIRDATARASVIVPFTAIPQSPIGALAAKFDFVLGYTPQNVPASTTPSIFAMNGVVHAAGFQPSVASGSWVSICGSNLAGSTRTWNAAADITGGKLPQALDGVSVTVDNKPAAVQYISPSQLNVQLPSDVAGAAQITVTASGNASAPAPVNVASIAPGFFLYAQHYISAVRADGAYLGPEGLLDGITTVPAKPGDRVLLFGTGFGPTSPEIPSGEVVTTPAPLANPVSIYIDGVKVDVSFAGLTSAGLYQFNVTIPDLPGGDHAVTAETGGAWTQSIAKVMTQA
jgi:protocatechuate 3,4-dioxygenase beta subunit